MYGSVGKGEEGQVAGWGQGRGREGMEGEGR